MQYWTRILNSGDRYLECFFLVVPIWTMNYQSSYFVTPRLQMPGMKLANHGNMGPLHGGRRPKNSGKALPPPFFRAMPERKRFCSLRLIDWIQCTCIYKESLSPARKQPVLKKSALDSTFMIKHIENVLCQSLWSIYSSSLLSFVSYTKLLLEHHN